MPTDEVGFEQAIERFPEPMQAVARAARELILDVLPQVYEVPWPHQGTIGYGTGPKKMSEHFSWIAPAKGHVGLGFFYGTELPDPEGLLEGTGRLLRHVKLRSMEDVRRPAIRRLLEVAITHRVPPPER